MEYQISFNNFLSGGSTDAGSMPRQAWTANRLLLEPAPYHGGGVWAPEWSKGLNAPDRVSQGKPCPRWRVRLRLVPLIWVALMGGAPTTQSPDGDSGHGDMECHLAGAERSWARAGGWAVPARESQTHLHAQSGLWSPTPWERLDSLLLWSCPRWEAASWCGFAYSSSAQPTCVGVHPSEWEGRLPAPLGRG